MDQIAINELNSKKEKMINSLQTMISELEREIESHRHTIEWENENYEKLIKTTMDDQDMSDQERQLECQIIETKSFVSIHKLRATIQATKDHIEYIRRRIQSF